MTPSPKTPYSSIPSPSTTLWWHRREFLFRRSLRRSLTAFLGVAVLAGPMVLATSPVAAEAPGEPVSEQPVDDAPVNDASVDGQPGPLAPEVQSLDLGLEAGWSVPEEVLADVGDLGEPTATQTSILGARLDLANAPEMVILDTAGQAATFAVRSRNDGVWSEWVSVESDNQDAPDGLAGEEGASAGQNSASLPAGAIGPIWIGEGSEAIEIIGLDGSVDSLRVETLKSRDQPEPQLQTTAPTALALAGQPAIQPRSAWASEGWEFGNENCDKGPHYASNVRIMVVHHTVTTNSYNQNQVDDILRGIYRTHVKVNGWCDVGYNFVVDKYGTIWEGRSGGIDKPVIGGHVKGFNTWSSGIGLLGQHQSGARPAAASPSQASLNSIAALASWKLGLHGIDPLGSAWMKSRTGATSGLRYPNGTWVEVSSIVGHRDLGFTSCPGSHAYSRLGGVRAASIRDLAIPYLAPTRKPLVSGPAFLTADAAGGLRTGGAAEYPTGAPASSGGVIAVAATGNGGFTLDASGTVRGFGGAGSPASKPAGGNQVVDLVVAEDGRAGYVLDSAGVLHPFNGASSVSGGSSSSVAAVAAALVPDGSGFVLDASGGLHPVGGAPERTIGQSVQAVDLGLLPDGQSGWVVDTAGALHPFGGAPDWQRHRGRWNGTARAVAVDPNGNGGWILDSEGRLDAFGSVRMAAPVSSTIGTPNNVDVALWWELRPKLVEAKPALFADALMKLFLGRDGSLRELDRLVWRAEFHGFDALADELANSDEWAGKIVDDIYRDVLGRDPDQEGHDYWVDQLRAGMRTQDLGVLFYSSPEYVAAAGSHEAYVRRLYLALLHREPEPEGLAYWVNRLENGGAHPAEISGGFYGSPESRRDRVTRLYDSVLGRLPDPEGLEYWAGQLLVGDDIELAKNLAVSEEFYRIATVTRD